MSKDFIFRTSHRLVSVRFDERRVNVHTGSLNDEPDETHRFKDRHTLAEALTRCGV